MIVPDINILIYALNKDHVYHRQAKRWLEKAVSGGEAVGLSWIVILGFLRIVTSEKIMANPIDMETAFRIVDGWLEFPAVRIIEPTDRHWSILKEILSPLGTAGNLTSDAHLAALAVEYGGRLYSTDNDFARFRGVRWKNPLQPEKNG